MDAARAAPDRGGLKVLVVDDSRDSAVTLAVLVRLWGYEAHVALSGGQALEMAWRLPFDVAFVDIGMPGVDGWEVAKGLGLLRRPPLVVAVTGYGGEEDRRRSYESGVHLHLLKPADPVTLGAVLARFQRVMDEAAGP